MLGLGDIILPGLYLVFLRFWDLDNQKKTRNSPSYFLLGVIGYSIGLFAAYVMVSVLRNYWSGQPALLYLGKSHVTFPLSLTLSAWCLPSHCSNCCQKR